MLERRNPMSHLARTLLVAALVAAGCAAPQRPPPARLVPVDGTTCKRIGLVRGVGIGGVSTTHDMMLMWATKEAMKQAEDIRATNVLFVRESGSEHEQLTLEGDAYACK
jgi:hypothetical protein